ncbi:hypothetical protein [Cryptosporangium phraense]|uniref:hypothetical protein n=1 Tax=Cryptosporangium phraense TaxID=2593070 RepID=UPI00197AC1C1|nr:hypothetical protein [Cryptosporangium phraense]
MSLRNQPLGAWLLKGNADRADLAARFAEEPRVSQWCVQPSYRTRLMRPGQPVVFWASGRDGRRVGFWGLGALAGEPELDPDDGRWHVPLDLTIAPEHARVPRDELRADPRLHDLEIFRQPQGSNPSYLTVEQLEALREHFDE